MWSRRTDERGSIIILATVGIVLSMIAAALAVDLGRLASDKRTDQKIADLAALDAARQLTSAATACTAAQASATRNGYGSLACSDVVLGYIDPVSKAFVAGGVMDTVQVKVRSAFSAAFPFVSGPSSTGGKAAAAIVPHGGFTLGSSLVTLNTSQSTLLNPVIGQMIGGSSLSLSLVSWRGLSTGSITLAALKTQLASMGFTVGSVSQLLTTSLTVAQLYQATANALTLGGDSVDASVLNVLKLAATFTTQIKLGDFLNVDQGSDGVALGSRLNLLQLVNGSAQASALDGSHTVSISNLGLTVPGVASTGLTLSVIDPPKTYIGAKGGPVPPLSTGQIDLTLTPKLDLDVTIAGLVGAKVMNDLPVRVSVAGAKGYIKDITCGTTPSMTVNVDPTAFSGSATTSTPLRLATVVSLPVVGTVTTPLLDVGTTSAVPSTDAPAQDVAFSYPTEFFPTASSKHIGSQPVGLQGLTRFTAGTTTVLGVLPLPTATVVTTIFNALSPVLGSVDNTILTPLLSALGMDIGGADVTALADAFKCDTPGLVG
ncbi:MAG: pilus assembly protein TadG-related protein [Acidimicrobiales bacterium]